MTCHVVAAETTLGIGELRAKHDSVQQKTFTRWWNSWLTKRGDAVGDLCEDVKSGVKPLALLEALTGAAITAHRHPTNRFQMLENGQAFFRILSDLRIKLVGIGPDNLVDGNRTSILGLTWTLIKQFEMRRFGIEDPELLQWVRSNVAQHNLPVEDWGYSFNDGQVFAALVDRFASKDLKLVERSGDGPAELLRKAFDAAEEVLGVPHLLDPSDLVGPGAADEKSVIVYTAKVRQAILDKEKRDALMRLQGEREQKEQEGRGREAERAERIALGWRVLEHVNRARTDPAGYAAHLRERFASCYKGCFLSPPWEEGEVQTAEGWGGMDDLCVQLERLQPLPAVRLQDPLVSAAHDCASELQDAPQGESASPLEGRLSKYGTWAGAAGEAIVYGTCDAEAIVVSLLLSDGDPSRRNREFVLHEGVKAAGLAMGPHATAGVVCVLSLCSRFVGSLGRELSVTCEGEASPDFEEILSAVPSDQAREVATTALADGATVTLDYTISQLLLTLVKRGTRKKVYTLPLT